MAKELTDKQQLIFNFIKQSINESGYPPTVREIGDQFKITVKGAYDHLKAIEKKGFLKTQQNKSRAIVITEETTDDVIDSKSIKIPLVGRIAAGSPVLAQENIEEYLSFPAAMLGNGDFFALSVSGDSMIDGGIFDNDIAIIKQQSTAVNGDVVAALIDDEATLKVFNKTAKSVQLIAQNPAYKPIETREVTILGKLAGIFRQY